MFKRILIANRGEIACRIIETLRHMGIEAVAVYSDADRKSRHVAMADFSVRIGPAEAKDSYLAGDRIIKAALEFQAEAIHPGYGFLSESADFAEACVQAGLVFIGPPASAIRSMGSKSRAKALMSEAGVPVTPGYHGILQDPDHLKTEACKIGFPVLIKASAGGGGKGMRLVEEEGEFLEALASCQREAQSSFGDDRVLIERFVTRPRHIEMQIFADTHGNAVHLFERDCSLQRRHQKVVEEAPAPAMPEGLRVQMGQAAVAAAKAVGYCGAGTVEFIVETSQEGTPESFFFMEMNTRLQVEHPVTEMVTGQDLVAWQLHVAAGDPLPAAQQDLTVTGHAVEVRLYAEDPALGFLPSVGTLTKLDFPTAKAGIRIDSGVREGDGISPYYDPMIAKLISHGSSRIEAIRRLIAGLRQTRIAGITSNRDFLIQLLSHERFQSEQFDTGFIAQEENSLLARDQLPAPAILIGAALALLDKGDRDAQTRTVLSGVSDSPWQNRTGWRLGERAPIPVLLGYGTMRSTLKITRDGECCLVRMEDGHVCHISSLRVDLESVSMEVDGVPCQMTVHRSGNRLTVFRQDQTVVLTHLDPLEGAGPIDQTDHMMTAPMPGKVTAILVSSGDTVVAGQSLMTLEAMKMEHIIKAPAEGRIASLPFAVGDQVEEGEKLVLFDGGDEKRAKE